MKLTLESDYALRIIFVLARENKKTDAKTISEESAVPRPFALKILRKLMESGIVSSDRGASGGYMLVKNPKELSVYDILCVTEDDLCVARCKDENYECSRMGKNKELCAFHRFFCDISEKLNESLKQKTIEDILNNNT